MIVNSLLSWIFVLIYFWVSGWILTYSNLLQLLHLPTSVLAFYSATIWNTNPTIVHVLFCAWSWIDRQTDLSKALSVCIFNLRQLTDNQCNNSVTLSLFWIKTQFSGRLGYLYES